MATTRRVSKQRSARHPSAAELLRERIEDVMGERVSVEFIGSRADKVGVLDFDAVAGSVTIQGDRGRPLVVDISEVKNVTVLDEIDGDDDEDDEDEQEEAPPARSSRNNARQVKSRTGTVTVRESKPTGSGKGARIVRSSDNNDDEADAPRGRANGRKGARPGRRRSTPVRPWVRAVQEQDFYDWENVPEKETDYWSGRRDLTEANSVAIMFRLDDGDKLFFFPVNDEDIQNLLDVLLADDGEIEDVAKRV